LWYKVVVEYFSNHFFLTLILNWLFYLLVLLILFPQQ
jgi:hypothetical protein